MGKLKGLSTKQHKIINLKQLATKTNIEYMKLYYNVKGGYSSLDANEKTMLMNVLTDELETFVKYLGFTVKLQRIK